MTAGAEGSRVRHIPALLVAAALAGLVAGCVPAESATPTPTPTESSPTPSATPTATDAPLPSGLPDLRGTALFAIDLIARTDGGQRFRFEMTGYEPLETDSVEGRQIEAELARRSQGTSVFETAVAREGVIQFLDVRVTGIDGSWPLDYVMPMTVGFGTQDALLDVPVAPRSGATFLTITGTGEGFAVSALTGAGPVSLGDWAQLPLQYGFFAVEGWSFDACDISTTALAGDFPEIASWQKGPCTFGIL